VLLAGGDRILDTIPLAVTQVDRHIARQGNLGGRDDGAKPLDEHQLFDELHCRQALENRLSG
jgi:hypothetical protein